MNDILSLNSLQGWLQSSQQWILETIITPSTLAQIAFLVVVFLMSMVVGKRVQGFFKTQDEHYFFKQINLTRLLHAVFPLFPYIFSVLCIGIGILVAQQLEYSLVFLNLVNTLLMAWVLIQLITSIILDRFWIKLIAISIWILTALSILDLLDPLTRFLDKTGFTFGDINLTALSVLKALIVFFVLFQLSIWLSNYLERLFKNISTIPPSTHVLLGKITKIMIYVAIFLVALNSIGINITSLAVFSGAIGVGIGLGLQKGAANFISGIILLLDKSVKPGDVIQIGDVYGWIHQMRSRYVSVLTRDGTEYLIPNDDLINQQVINWSFSDHKIRLRVPIGISYKSNPHQAIALVLEAIQKIDRILLEPEPRCLLTSFGESSLDLELRFWIDDPQNGTANVKNDVLLSVWDKFKENGIEIPFPQRDVHLYEPQKPLPPPPQSSNSS